MTLEHFKVVPVEFKTSDSKPVTVSTPEIEMSDKRIYFLKRPNSPDYTLEEIDLKDKNNQISLLFDSERDKLQKYMDNKAWIPPHLTIYEVELRHQVMEGILCTPIRIVRDKSGILSIKIEGLGLE